MGERTREGISLRGRIRLWVHMWGYLRGAARPPPAAPHARPAPTAPRPHGRSRASLSARPVPASPRPVPPRPAPLPPSEGIKLRAGAGGPSRSGAEPGGSAAAGQRRAMASEELAQKLQRRLQLEESGAAAEGEAAAGKGEEAAAGDEAERSCLTASAGAELSAKLCRRQDINEGAAQPRPSAVFNPYTEFKEFSRRQIKDMERMFRL